MVQSYSHFSIPCGLYYKHMMIVIDNSSIVIKRSFKLIDAARGVIYDCHMFIVQSTGVCRQNDTFESLRCKNESTKCLSAK